jgi:hypothetical protein
MSTPRNLRDLALEIAAITTVIDHLTEKKETLRSEFQGFANELGADATKAMLDGKEIAKISLVNPKPKPHITDEKAFLTYVKTFHAIEIVESVRDSFKKVFLDRVAPHEDGAIDPETGELFDFVEFKQGNAYISTRFQPEGRASIIEAIANHHLPLAIGDGQ